MKVLLRLLTGMVFLAGVLSAMGMTACGKEKDTVPPVITLLGANPLSVELGTSFADPGATAMDDIDGDISEKIKVTGSVNMQAEGDYLLYYNVKDAAGNKAQEVQRKVKVLVF